MNFEKWQEQAIDEMASLIEQNPYALIALNEYSERDWERLADKPAGGCAANNAINREIARRYSDRVIIVAFDYDQYSAWLRDEKGWKDSSQARSQWAAQKARKS